jgi:serine/threonine-protein kinase RsbW
MGNKATQIRIELPATFEQLAVIDGCVRALVAAIPDLPDRELISYNVELAVHETCTNIVEHAYAGQSGRIQAEITLESDPRRLVVDLYDSGRAFDLTAVPPPNLDEPQEAGYGLFLVRHLMDAVKYESKEGKNHWRLIKNLKGGQQ